MRAALGTVLNRFVLVAVILAQAQASDVAPAGDWHGDSICQQKNTACRDEKVIYHISAPDTAGKITVSADKIVEGQPVNMGKILFDYNREKQILRAEDGPRIWHFQIDGHAMHGTLMASGTLVRKVELTKD